MSGTAWRTNGTDPEPGESTDGGSKPCSARNTPVRVRSTSTTGNVPAALNFTFAVPAPNHHVTPARAEITAAAENGGTLFRLPPGYKDVDGQCPMYADALLAQAGTAAPWEDFTFIGPADEKETRRRSAKKIPAPTRLTMIAARFESCEVACDAL